MSIIENGTFYLNVLVFSFLHECAHAGAVARVGGRGRLENRGIFGNVLLLKGGLGATQRLIIYLAGPAFNIVCAAAAVILCAAGRAGFQAAVTDGSPGLHILLYEELRLAAYANIMLAAFNMLPFYPLDGGRAAVLLLSYIFSKRAAYIFAGIFSRLFAVSIFFLGLYLVQYNIINVILMIDAFYFIYIFERETDEIF